MSTAISTATSSLDPDDDEEVVAKSPSLETPRRSSEAASATAGSTASPFDDHSDDATAKMSIATDTTIASEAVAALPTAKEPGVVKYSSVKGSNNPLTLSRERKIREGAPLIVKFDERVVVHTVPYWDPCGDTFYDTDDPDGPRGPNCCAVL